VQAILRDFDSADGAAMSRLSPLNHDLVDCHILVEPRPDGPVIGFFAGQPIAEAVVDPFGRRFVYEGVAPRRRNGQYDVRSLRKGEWIAEPGLVYQFDRVLPNMRGSPPLKRVLMPSETA
jgi:hypothetical protein